MSPMGHKILGLGGLNSVRQRSTLLTGYLTLLECTSCIYCIGMCCVYYFVVMMSELNIPLLKCKIIIKSLTIVIVQKSSGVQYCAEHRAMYIYIYIYTHSVTVLR